MLKRIKKCDRCGKVLEEGDDFYEVLIEIKAGFDGTIKAPEEQLEELISESEVYSEEELLRSVYEKRNYILCVRCKEVWISNPFLKDF